MSEITSGTTSSGVVVTQRDPLTVDFGGSSLATVIETDASLTIAARGWANISRTLANSYIHDAGTLSGGVLVGHLMVTSGGVASGVVDEWTTIISAGGSGSHVTVSSAGGIAPSLAVKAGAKVSDDIVLARGTEILAGGVAYRTQIMARGEQVVSAHGVAQATTVESGGTLEGFGTVRGAILRGGTLSAFGTVDSATIWAGTLDQSAGTISGKVLLKGGEAVIGATVAAGAEIIFQSAATLELLQGSVVDGAIYGMTASARQVDLQGFSFSSGETASWVQSGTSGTLTITDGGQVETLMLVGAYATSNFHLSDDTNGGTIVYEKATPHALFAQAAAGLDHGRGASVPMVHGGGAIRPIASVVVATSGRA